MNVCTIVFLKREGKRALCRVIVKQTVDKSEMRMRAGFISPTLWGCQWVIRFHTVRFHSWRVKLLGVLTVVCARWNWQFL